jgi:hypothetical protein
MGPGKEISWTQVPQYGQMRTIDGQRTDRVVAGDRFFMWPGNGVPFYVKDSWPSDGPPFYIGFKNDRVVEKDHYSMPLF